MKGGKNCRYCGYLVEGGGPKRGKDFHLRCLNQALSVEVKRALGLNPR